jgi:uncharacterized coiled-coil protein SlyX
MTPTDLDTLIAKLKGPDAVTVQDIEPKTLAAGLEDLRNRMSHVEHAHLKVLANSRAKDDRLTELETTVASLVQDRNEMQRTVKTATDLPIANQKQLAELSDRVRSCEGAVGEAPYKVPKPIEPAKPATPVVAPTSTPAPSTGIFGSPAPNPMPQPA